MWIVLKYKVKELNLLKRKFRDFFDESINFYIPKIKYQKVIGTKLKTFEKFVLEGYLICYHKKFYMRNEGVVLIQTIINLYEPKSRYAI